MPVDAIQNVWRNAKIKGALKGVLLTVIFLAACIVAPSTDSTEKKDSSSSTKNVQTVSDDEKTESQHSSDSDQKPIDDIEAPETDNLDDSENLGDVVTLPVIESEPNEEDKEKVLKMDSAIWDRVISTETNYNNLLTTMSSTNSLYSLYSFCEDLEDVMDKYMSDLSKISDDRAKEYTDCAGIYMAKVRSITSHVRKYVNNTNMEELSKAETEMEELPAFVEAIVAARFSYLSSCGFTNDEIIEIGNSSIQ